MRLDNLSLRVTESDPVDLHLHTVVYDGFWTPETLIDYAQENGFKIIAISDHDSVANVGPACRLAADRGIVVLPAVEVTARFNEVIQHLLLYNVAIEDPALLAMLDEARRAQTVSAERGLHNLQQRGFELPDLDAIVAGRDLMPYYVAVALVRAGYAQGFWEAVAMASDFGVDFEIATDMARAIDVAHRQGALAVLAHPARADAGCRPASFELVKQMLAIGLDGLEAYHALHSPQDTAAYVAFAEQHNMLISCGSDSHGPKARTRPIPWPARNCRRLLEAVGFEVLS